VRTGCHAHETPSCLKVRHGFELYVIYHSFFKDRASTRTSSQTSAAAHHGTGGKELLKFMWT
jgi:hypothetical protein